MFHDKALLQADRIASVNNTTLIGINQTSVSWQIYGKPFLVQMIHILKPYFLSRVYMKNVPTKWDAFHPS